MSRIVSVSLPRWPILRFMAAQARTSASPAPLDPEQPFVLAADAFGGPLIPALNSAASGKACRPATRWPTRAPRPAVRCRCALSIEPRIRPPCGGWRCGRPATRRPYRLGRGERRGRPVPRHHWRRASVRWRGEAAGRPAAPSEAVRPAGAARHRRRPRSGLGPLPLPSLSDSRAALRAGNSRPCSLADRGATPVAKHPCNAAAARLQARRRVGRQPARTLSPPAFRPSCSGVSTRPAAACPSRSPSWLHRPPITACASCSSRSVRRRRSFWARPISCRTSFQLSNATAWAPAAYSLPSTASTARW